MDDSHPLFFPQGSYQNAINPVTESRRRHSPSSLAPRSLRASPPVAAGVSRSLVAAIATSLVLWRQRFPSLFAFFLGRNCSSSPGSISSSVCFAPGMHIFELLTCYIQGFFVALSSWGLGFQLDVQILFQNGFRWRYFVYLTLIIKPVTSNFSKIIDEL